MSNEARPFPIYQLQDAFEAFCNGEPAAKPQHRSLYYFLLGYCRRRGNTPRFSLAYEAGMHGSGIGSWATYDAALKALAEWGFIVYTPGANRYKVPVVELTFRNPTDDVLLTYWQSYCLSTSNSTDNPTDDVLLTQVVTLKEVLKKEKEKVGKLESEKTQLQADVAAAGAALAEAQKKIEGLLFEIDSYATELYADPLPPGPLPESPTPGLRTPGGAADVGTRKEPPKLKATRGGKQLMADSPLADYAAFVAAWDAAAAANPETYAPYAGVNLAYYHGALLDWSTANGQKKADWLATVRGSIRRDNDEGRLRKAGQPTYSNPQQHAVTRPSYSNAAGIAAARLQTPTPDATSSNPWGIPGRGPAAASTTTIGG